MHKIIKNGAIIDDQWITVLDKTISSVDALPSGDLILPLALWKLFADKLSARKIGVWLNSDENASELKDVCHSMPIIAINFPIFTDGRGYSSAHILRAQYHYHGELRAIGDVLRDQLFYMKRCGFDSYAMRADQKLDLALNNFKDFSISYQASIDKKTPLFLER